MKDVKHVLYLCGGLGMLLYAVPRLELGYGLTASTVFGVLWICFALLFIAAQLHFLLGVDEEMKQELSRVRRVRRRQMQSMLEGRAAMFLGKK